MEKRKVDEATEKAKELMRVIHNNIVVIMSLLQLIKYISIVTIVKILKKAKYRNKNKN